MSVETPKDRAYYFECSFGRTRLTYFIPVEHLKQMVADGKIQEAVLEDFPDGVDLDCTEPDFEDFRASYGFRPEFNAELLRDSFFAMYSTTNDWEKFHGTGFVKAEDLERNVESVRQQFENEDIQPEGIGKSLPPEMEFSERRYQAQAQNRMQSRMTKVLIDLKVPEVAADKTIQQQSFAQVPMSGEEPAAVVFERLHRKQNR